MYKILWNSVPVGDALVSKVGLFYRFSCVCNIPDNGIYKVYVLDASDQVELGICVPDGNAYTCVASVPCKRFQNQDWKFILIDCNKRKFVEVADGKPFQYIEKLNTARLHITNGQHVLIIDSAQGPQDSDQNQVYQHK